MRLLVVAAAALLAAGSAGAQTGGGKGRPAAFGDLGSNKDPIKIDADRLDVFDKESRAVFAGNVVAVQGESTMKCTALTVFYEPRKSEGGQKAASAAPAAAGAPGGSAESQIQKIDCKGPVTIVSKTQTATGDNASFDRVANKVFLTGNVALSDGPNVTRGEKLVYDLNTAVANMETTPGGRVKALFVPGSNTEKPAGGEKAKPKNAATN
jgi:lipopolysaccharide export system protein LptA